MAVTNWHDNMVRDGRSCTTGVMEFLAAERCLWERGRLAFAAAASAGLPGQFRAVQVEGMLGLLTTAPGLEFLNSVSGVTEDSLDALPDVLSEFASAGAPAPVLTSVQPTKVLAEGLRRLELAPSGPRPVAVIDLPGKDVWTSNSAERGQIRVSEAETKDEVRIFLDILAAGYAAAPPLAAFLLVEHSTVAMRRFLAWCGDEPVAAAAMSVHDDTAAAVFGGAATLPTRRGAGAQRALLHHRIERATKAGTRSAAATAAPNSASLRNLTRVGFTICSRVSWHRTLG